MRSKLNFLGAMITLIAVFSASNKPVAQVKSGAKHRTKKRCTDCDQHKYGQRYGHGQ